NRPQHGCLASARGTHQRDALATLSGKRHALHDRAAVAIHVQVEHLEDRSHWRQPFSIRLAKRASGNDSSRYMAAHIAPGSTQLPMFAAKIDVCFVSSTTVMTETSELSFSSATKSFVIGASASRNACGARTRRNVCVLVKPSVRAASS